MMNEHQIHLSAERLSSKHDVAFEDAMEVLMFFINFNLHWPYYHAELLITSAKSWGIPPVQLINFGLENCFSKINKQ